MALGLNVLDSLKPRHAFIASGLFFMFMGFLLFDTHLIFAGNIVFSLGVISKISSYREISSYALFMLGFLISFVFIPLGVGIELVSLLLLVQSKLLLFLVSPKRALFSLLRGSRDKDR
ncbi:hypothetical protein NECID01_1968 [Nematocida sp. AWRm77]|nr:hypothetical protein NECID01_1968 [Nematocida sp. AWRm77]